MREREREKNVRLVFRNKLLRKLLNILKVCALAAAHKSELTQTNTTTGVSCDAQSIKVKGGASNVVKPGNFIFLASLSRPGCAFAKCAPLQSCIMQ